MALMSAGSALTQPLELPLVGGDSPITTGPGEVSGATWICAAVAGAMFSAVSEKQTSPSPWLNVNVAVPVPSGSPGPGRSAAPVMVTEIGRPPPSAVPATARLSSNAAARAKRTEMGEILIRVSLPLVFLDD